MKSSKKQLEERGFVSAEDLSKHKNISDEQAVNFLKSPIPCERTLGAKILTSRKNENSLPILCESLAKEKKLYPKIALSEAIEQHGISSMKYLLPLLGKIGNNQHRKIALVDINKKSFPLPRDMAARIIIRIGEPALPFLEEILVSGTYSQKLEAIDAVGHIAYNFNQYRSEKYLHNLLKENSHDDMIVWKIIRAFQAFSSSDVEKKLRKIILDNKNVIFMKEAKRSLLRIKERRESNPVLQTTLDNL